MQRSRSAFSFTSDDSPEKGPEEEEEEEAAAAAAAGGGALQEYASLKREGKAASLPGWKSMDRLDNSSKDPSLVHLIACLDAESERSVYIPLTLSVFVTKCPVYFMGIVCSRDPHKVLKTVRLM